MYLPAWLFLIVFTSLVLSTPVSGQNHSDLSAKVDKLIEFVGLNAQIGRTAALIIAEATQAREQCDAPVIDIDSLNTYLGQLYAPDELAVSARAYLMQRLSGEQIDEILTWSESPLGKKIYAAESALNTAEPVELMQLENQLLASSFWNDERKRQIYKVIRATRIHHYVSAYNSAISNAVEMASVCKPDSGSLNGIEIKQHRERADEKLIAGVMLKNFIVPTGVILQPLTNAELEAYFLFSVSPNAKTWYASVIDAARAVIAERIPQIRSFIELPVEPVSESVR